MLKVSDEYAQAIGPEEGDRSIMTDVQITAVRVTSGVHCGGKFFAPREEPYLVPEEMDSHGAKRIIALGSADSIRRSTTPPRVEVLKISPVVDDLMTNAQYAAHRKELELEGDHHAQIASLIKKGVLEGAVNGDGLIDPVKADEILEAHYDDGE
ncbi:MAG: hypothetical protein GY835_05700 [bacterium]|nr:hypothetical protein [bacterium]